MKKALKELAVVFCYLLLSLTAQAGLLSDDVIDGTGRFNNLWNSFSQYPTEGFALKTEPWPYFTFAKNGSEYWLFSMAPYKCQGVETSIAGWCPKENLSHNLPEDDAAEEVAEMAKAVNTHPKVVAAIVTASSETGVDPNLMLSLAWMESRFDNNVKNNSSTATGLYQFTRASWRSALQKFAEKHKIKNVKDKANQRKMPKISAVVAAENIKSKIEALEGHFGRPLTRDEVYLAHLLGEHGAERFIEAKENSPRLLCLDIIPVAARNNPGLFFSGKTPLTIGEASQKIKTLVNTTYRVVKKVTATKTPRK